MFGAAAFGLLGCPSDKSLARPSTSNAICPEIAPSVAAGHRGERSTSTNPEASFPSLERSLLTQGEVPELGRRLCSHSRRWPRPSFFGASVVSLGLPGSAASTLERGSLKIDATVRSFLTGRPLCAQGVQMHYADAEWCPSRCTSPSPSSRRPERMVSHMVQENTHDAQAGASRWDAIGMRLPRQLTVLRAQRWSRQAPKSP